MKVERHDPRPKRAASKRIQATCLGSLLHACRSPKTGVTFGRHALGAIAFGLVVALSGCQSKSGASDVLDPSAIAAPAGQTGNAAAQQASGATVGSQTSGSQTLAGPTSAEAAKANLTLGT